MLTVHQEFTYARQAVGLGACDYLVKDMGYRAQLPQVLERAKSAFEGTENDLAAFLGRGGRLLTIGENGVNAAIDELSLFLKRFGGTLITARFGESGMERGELLPLIDQCMTESIGFILHGEECVEIVGCDDVKTRAYWRNLTSGAFDKAQWIAAYSGNVHTPDQYIRAHEKNIMTIETAFYDGAFSLLAAKDADFSDLPAALTDAWAQQALSAASDDSFDDYSERLLSDIKTARYTPSQVRQAFSQVLRRVELRWADSMDMTAHDDLRRAQTLERALSLLSEHVARVRAKEGALSYQCEKAIEFMRGHLRDPELSLAATAESVYISPGYLSKRLKEETGVAFKELLIRLRMERAAELIGEGRYKVYEIATETGYQNYRSFAVAFESYYGVSAKKFKGRNQ